jgi:hypothetical protein
VIKMEHQKSKLTSHNSLQKKSLPFRRPRSQHVKHTIVDYPDIVIHVENNSQFLLMVLNGSMHLYAFWNAILEVLQSRCCKLCACLTYLWVGVINDLKNWMTHWHNIRKEHPRLLCRHCHHKLQGNLHNDLRKSA